MGGHFSLFSALGAPAAGDVPSDFTLDSAPVNDEVETHPDPAPARQPPGDPAPVGSGAPGAPAKGRERRRRRASEAKHAPTSELFLDGAPPDGRLLSSRGASGFELWLLALLGLAILLPGIWSYTLIDPWETHYAEVARRMLQDGDLVHTKWQDEGFRSKPVFIFWLIAGSLRLFGLAAEGGFSGEMTSTPLVMFAVRLPFVLFGLLGLLSTFWMLARLVNRRVAWLAALVLGTTPFYILVARQAITDMPMVACLTAAMACFSMAIHSGDAALRPMFTICGRGLHAYHLFAAALTLFVGWQILYYAYYFTTQPRLAVGVRFPVPQLIVPGVMLAGLVGFLVWAGRLSPTRYARQVYMYWFYALLAVSVLAKGLPAIGLAGLICFAYILLTGHWQLLRKVEIPRGVLLCLLIVVPWHICMLLKDGRPFLRDYFITHLWRRAAVGVHGERGTFDFYINQLGIGMWPWIALVPASIVGVIGRCTGKTRTGSVRLLCSIWAIVGVAFFSLVQTKFHHYILPVVPALAVLMAFWLDDVLSKRIRHAAAVSLSGAAIALLLMRDFIGEHELLIEISIYRYDRPWPTGAPWLIDASDGFLGFGLVVGALLCMVAIRRLRNLGIAALAVVALAYTIWSANVYMQHAGTHWGMRDSMALYYRMRQLHGLDIRYHNNRQLADEWADRAGPYPIDTVIPDHLSVGQPMRIRLEVADPVGKVTDTLDLTGRVSEIGEHRLWVTLDIDAIDGAVGNAGGSGYSERFTDADREAAAQQRRELDRLIAAGHDQPRADRRPWRQVNADRMIAWQLYWRGENFWTGDEIWGPFDDTKTAYKDTDNEAFLKYLKADGRADRRYYVMTESGRANGLKNILPTSRAKRTFEIVDTSSNKFTLLTFVL